MALLLCSGTHGSHQTYGMELGEGDDDDEVERGGGKLKFHQVWNVQKITANEQSPKKAMNGMQRYQKGVLFFR